MLHIGVYGTLLEGSTASATKYAYGKHGNLITMFYSHVDCATLRPVIVVLLAQFVLRQSEEQC